MKKPRIVFMGTPDFAVATLAALHKNDFSVVGVITAPDKPAGRGRKLNESAVKQFALANGLPVLQPTNLKDDDFLNHLKSLKPDLQIVVAFRMLPKAVWEIPNMGTFNLHASLLPDYRGAAPINWAIINGEKETGATTFFIDEKIDTGEILLQEKIQISEGDTAGSLHDRLMELGAKLVIETVNKLIAGEISPKKQQADSHLKVAHKLHRQTCEIDWGQSLDQINNKIRGLSPYPTAWSTLYNDEAELFVKIYASTKEVAAHPLKIGTVVATKSELKVAVAGGYINLMEIQLPGKRKMTTKEVLNGLKLKKNAFMR
ncbi:Methionyl-tRNA formyltransferase [Arenibacter antarcticus]|uniref:Methionyl-tRNA formyltransferase n=1 Tax=Arenibacter antarcticus TaxID=2040469 RepID=A0ABW5VI73_9FLAO|nr:methionyl-tRNA formyltransferase [Arenibacter sp. H213]MCM4166560.1 methionyl-tRNA formyltransferase [Arenibacter sp. H213]